MGKNDIQFVMIDDVTAVKYSNRHLIYHTTDGTVEGAQQWEAFNVSVLKFMKRSRFLKASASLIINANHIRSVDVDDFIMNNGSV